MKIIPDFAVKKPKLFLNKRNDNLPAAIWEDIYILNNNGLKTINNRYIYGPSLIMKGITIVNLIQDILFD